VKNILNSYFALIRRFLPDQSVESAIGLDIGTSNCKLVEIGKSGDHFKLLKWAIHTFEKGDVGASVKKILNEIDSPGNINTAVAGKGTLIRYVDMPKMALEDLKNSIALEADKYFPFAQDQIYTDCYILDSTKNSKEMSVLAAAAKKDLIDDRINVLSELNVNAEFIGINAISLANVVNTLGFKEEFGSKMVLGLLDMGDSVSNLTIFEGNLPRFSRDIFLGGKELTKRISNAMGIKPEEAEQLKITPGKKQEEIISACESGITSIVKEIRLSFDYFTTEKNLDVGKLLITGGGGMLKGLEGLFEKSLEISTSQWDPLETLGLDNNISQEELNKEAMRMGVALGLALYNYDRD